MRNKIVMPRHVWGEGHTQFIPQGNKPDHPYPPTTFPIRCGTIPP